eukprot:CAMPEP_0184703468 /NCGR_PEP_ID=MMETSP0313-20130426/27902_1 /TAXON_ID=2792 /ORGANISM="Porphyridium aerugineum, Strain SAG 1380-2" /LENGTH=79 /DNA_ID=CAMNT_0027164237 /DNA_START=29 /DNA_END=265 /DNA_ORIENTATION=+
MDHSEALETIDILDTSVLETELQSRMPKLIQILESYSTQSYLGRTRLNIIHLLCLCLKYAKAELVRSIVDNRAVQIMMD